MKTEHSLRVRRNQMKTDQANAEELRSKQVGGRVKTVSQRSETQLKGELSRPNR